VIRRFAAGAAAGLALLTVAEPAGAGESADGVDRVLVISLPHIAWQDIQDRDLPALGSLLDDSAVADLTTRSVDRETSLSDGYLTLGAGGRSVGGDDVTDGQAFEVDEPFGLDTAGDVFARRTGEVVADGIVHLGIAAIEDENDAQPLDTEVGALGDALADAGWSRAVIANADGVEPETDTPRFRRDAAAAVMNAAGTVPDGLVDDTLLEPDPNAPYGVRMNIATALDAFEAAWTPHSLVLVEASDLVRADAYRPLATSDQRDVMLDAALTRADELTAAILDDVNLDEDVVIVVGPTHPERAVRLTVLGVHAPGVEPGLLRSATTRRSGFVQLIDVAPTILDLAGITRPDSMEGRPAEVGRTGGDAADRVEFLVDADRASRFRDDLVIPVAIAFVVLQAGLAFLAGYGLKRAPVRPYVELGALVVLGFVPAVFLARLFPFYEIGTGAFAAFVIAVSIALGLVYRVCAQRSRVDGVLVGLLVTVALLALDVVLGAPLQFVSPLGFSPTVAGRFTGFGNLGFAAFAASAVLASGLLAHRVGGRRGAWIAVGLLAFVVVIDGMPFWGSDVGGVLSMVPAFVVTAFLLLGIRVRGRTLLIAGAATVATILGFALIDLSRPSNRRTHLGRLFESGGDEGFLTTVDRKLQASLSILPRSIWTLMCLVVGASLLWLAFVPPRWLRSLLTALPELRAALIGFTGVAVLGFALNDSGIAVPGVMVGVLHPVLIALLARILMRPEPADLAPAREVTADHS
jgi:hypothetical protein